MNMLGLAKRVNARILQASTSEVRRWLVDVMSGVIHVGVAFGLVSS